MSSKLTVLGLLLCVAGCSTTPTPRVGPPNVQDLLQTESVEAKYKSRDALMADPKATPIDTDNQLIATEAALRKANRDQIDVATALREEIAKLCGWWDKLRKLCGE